MRKEKTMKNINLDRLVCTRIPTEEGSFQLCLFDNDQDHKEHMALVYGDVRGKDVLVRVHSECFTGDVLGSQRCDCGPQLHYAMDAIANEGRGIVLYLRQEGRGIGLAEKLRAYNLQDKGLDTVDANLELGHQADEREYDIAVAMLKNLGVESVRLLTNNPAKIEALTDLGMLVKERVSIMIQPNDENIHYLSTKAERMRHLFAFERVPVRI
jgi:GTP cyclohydrolase II